MEEETKYSFTTTNQNNANLMVNSQKLAEALYTLMMWRGAMYNGNCNDTIYYYQGKIYDANSFNKLDNVDNQKVVPLLTEDKVVQKLGDALHEVEMILWQYFDQQ